MCVVWTVMVKNRWFEVVVDGSGGQNSFFLGKNNNNRVEVEGILCLGNRKEISFSEGRLYEVEEVGQVGFVG